MISFQIIIDHRGRTKQVHPLLSKIAVSIPSSSGHDSNPVRHPFRGSMRGLNPFFISSRFKLFEGIDMHFKCSLNPFFIRSRFKQILAPQGVKVAVVSIPSSSGHDSNRPRCRNGRHREVSIPSSSGHDSNGELFDEWKLRNVSIPSSSGHDSNTVRTGKGTSARVSIPSSSGHDSNHREKLLARIASSQSLLHQVTIQTLACFEFLEISVCCWLHFLTSIRMIRAGVFC